MGNCFATNKNNRISSSAKEIKKMDHGEFKTAKVTFGMACFWSPESQFGCARGVYRTRVGFANSGLRLVWDYLRGSVMEAVEVEFDPSVTTFEELVKLFLTFNSSKKFGAILYNDESEKRSAERLLKQDGSSKLKLLPASQFSSAGIDHQKYILQRHPEVMREAGIIRGPELLSSHVAARLNGYLGGFGSVQQLKAELPHLRLNQNLEKFMINFVQRHHS